MQAHPADQITEWITRVKDLGTIVGLVVAAFWFCVRWQFGRRATIGLGCEFFPVSSDSQTLLAEVAITVDNVGNVKQDIWGFEIFVNTVSDPAAIEVGQLAAFAQPLIKKSRFELSDGNLRPGVQRVYSFPFVLQSPSQFIRVSAALIYSEKKPPINQVDKIFDIRVCEKSKQDYPD
jgi:hypothetical protein